jgi:hypothetical protein
MLNPDQTKTPTSRRKDVLVEQERAYGEAIYSQLGDLQPTSTRKRSATTRCSSAAAIRTVEYETGLDFSTLREFDTTNAPESTRRTRFLGSLTDILV